eukprot:TRINITY_DN4401_c0_g1_i1.p1 TRINITY_DN4401_c0_g1~~TRINITY_DN4401_c0_g1_i1.p1  ORF type:complete len:380 (-),score=81.85 TRINITY_DN4401_c0_g1_i1:53-1192(-)
MKIFFCEVFEVGRRYKVMNPDKMRTLYGKLVFLLQDANSSAISRRMGFSVVKDIKTVYSFLKEKNSLEILDDEAVLAATTSIGQDIEDREAIIAQKEEAVAHICSTYANDDITEEEIHTCLRSIADNNAFKESNVRNLDKMIELLEYYFDPKEPERGFSLQIKLGSNGSRLAHSHSKQYNYVIQSLMLWRDIMKDMFKLWYLAEQDLLSSSNRYRLRNTGQGMNRVQSAPSIGNAMRKIIGNIQRSISGSWVGSSVVHLGDNDVPNALVFIDKYTQVPRIIHPIISVIEQIDVLDQDEGIHTYFEETWSGKESLKKYILSDFFKHGFDGSGADNYYDAGSCIDGRLTSAWNWGSRLDKKSYSAVFYLCGFIGFDGDWRN